MKMDTVATLTKSFDSITQTMPDSEVEFWYARDLMATLGYDRWENFSKVIQKALAASGNVGVNAENHFRGVTKMVKIGSEAERSINDVMLTRYACYLIAQNGDPAKEPIAFAQTYFAIQTRKQELIEKRWRIRSPSRLLSFFQFVAVIRRARKY